MTLKKMMASIVVVTIVKRAFMRGKLKLDLFQLLHSRSLCQAFRHSEIGASR